MSIIGASVIANKKLGVLLGWSLEKGYENSLRVRIYDTDDNKYKVKLVNPDDIVIVKDPEVLKLTNDHDNEAREAYLQFALEQSLIQKDEKWFMEISTELNILEEKKVGLGRIVMDMRGKNIGVVITEPDENRVVKVMTWNADFRKYVEYPKRIDLIQAATPEGIEKWNRTPNHMEIGLADNLREVLADAALATNDKPWFEKINAKEFSDGA